jgi:hypothetical protein
VEEVVAEEAIREDAFRLVGSGAVVYGYINEDLTPFVSGDLSLSAKKKGMS